MPCLHSGSCIDKLNGYECFCPQGWQGPQCQLDADQCEGRPCVNAHTCKDLLGDYECDCQLGWSGKNCDNSKTSAQTRKDNRDNLGKISHIAPYAKHMLLPIIRTVSLRRF